MADAPEDTRRDGKEPAMAWWREHVVPRIADRTLDTREVHDVRRRVCADLRGRVVEIGFGSGLNAAHYPAAVTEVDAVEPSDVGWRMAAERVRAAPVPVHRAGLDGQRLDLPDGAYDTALSTFTMCTIPDVSAALAELRRVLKPGGVLCFAEHGLAPDASVVRWQQRLEPLQKRVAGGCHLTRRIDDLVGDLFEVTRIESFYQPGPALNRPFGFVYVGSARVPA